MAFKLIAITPELTLPDEAWRITHLLDAGFDAVHLRKPHCGEEEMRGYVDTLPVGIADRLEHLLDELGVTNGSGPYRPAGGYENPNDDVEDEAVDAEYESVDDSRS